jgi:hypothetical protein
MILQRPNALCRRCYDGRGEHQSREKKVTMTISQADKAVEYIRNAERCLKIARKLPDRESRSAEREKAAEWLMLAWQDGASNRSTKRARKRASG